MLLVGLATLVANGTPFHNPIRGSLFDAMAYNVLQFGVPAVLLVRMADALVDSERLAAWVAYPAVVVATIVLGVWVIAPALYPVLGKASWWTRANDYELANSSLLWHAMGMTVYVQLRFSRRAQERLKILQDAASDRERQLAAASLLALQARVDPALLSERLSLIDAELLEQPQRALARLAALIDLLRALQPHIEAEVSTLKRELTALRAYATLISADALYTERLHFAGLAEPPDLPLAPMVLLPLVRPLLDEGRTFWSLSLRSGVPGADSAADAQGTELWLQGLGPDAQSLRLAAGRVPLLELARRLRTVLGEQATLELSAEEFTLFKLRWPPSS